MSFTDPTAPTHVHAQAAAYSPPPGFVLLDCYSAPLPDGASRDAAVLARHLFSRKLAWAGLLMRIRDAIVGVFGLKTSRRLRSAQAEPGVARIGFFRVYRTSQDEVLLGEDDRHLDFRISVRHWPSPGDPKPRRVFVATTVRCHNLAGRIYLAAVLPFHRLIVPAIVRRSARQGWPCDAPPGLQPDCR
jgi:hypothetical protein